MERPAPSSVPVSVSIPTPALASPLAEEKTKKDSFHSSYHNPRSRFDRSFQNGGPFNFMNKCLCAPVLDDTIGKGKIFSSDKKINNKRDNNGFISILPCGRGGEGIVNDDDDDNSIKSKTREVSKKIRSERSPKSIEFCNRPASPGGISCLTWPSIPFESSYCGNYRSNNNNSNDQNVKKQKNPEKSQGVGNNRIIANNDSLTPTSSIRNDATRSAVSFDGNTNRQKGEARTGTTSNKKQPPASPSSRNSNRTGLTYSDSGDGLDRETGNRKHDHQYLHQSKKVKKKTKANNNRKVVSATFFALSLLSNLLFVFGSSIYVWLSIGSYIFSTNVRNIPDNMLIQWYNMDYLNRKSYQYNNNDLNNRNRMLQLMPSWQQQQQGQKDTRMEQLNPTLLRGESKKKNKEKKSTTATYW